MQVIRKTSTKRKGLFGIFLEIIGITAVACGFLKLNNFLLECILIIAGVMIVFWGESFKSE